MRILLAITVATCAAFMGGSSAAAPSDPFAREATYLFHAQFDLDYKFDWVETSGDRFGSCSYRTDDRGSSDVSAASLTWIPGTLRIPRTLTSRTWSPTALVATGARKQGNQVPMNARVEMTRRLVQQGGTTPGCVTPPPPFRPPPNDCGAVAYTTRTATLQAGTLKSVGTLETLLASGTKAAIRVTVPATREPYRRCLTTLNAPRFPFLLPVGLSNPDLAALRNLKAGEKYRIQDDYAGHCKTGLPDTSSCHFDLDIAVTIRRWTPGTRFP